MLRTRQLAVIPRRLLADRRDSVLLILHVSRGNPKPFFNITKGKVNIAIRATDMRDCISGLLRSRDASTAQT